MQGTRHKCATVHADLVGEGSLEISTTLTWRLIYLGRENVELMLKGGELLDFFPREIQVTVSLLTASLTVLVRRSRSARVP